MDTLNQILDILIQVSQNHPLFGVFTLVVTLASTITALTPTPKAGSIASKLYKVIEILAINIGRAKEK